ncbi:hypothetical protein V2J09_002547 [Rumex salicifolius]
MEKIKMRLIAEDFEEEPFYEDIEAPKFVDLTRSDRFLPDDRYWFCSRVGCDLKHEEELDVEAVYKNFAIRAMAARSPNLRFQRALSKRQNETKKCPLSAPPKPSKPRIPKLALLSSVSRKLIDAKDTIQPPPKPITTPKARVKHVAAKYMTTPRIKKTIADSKPFNSVSNLPKTSSRILKPKLVAKALSFTSPKKVVKVKSLEDQSTTTPIKKLCSGMKKLEITDKKKGAIEKLPSVPRACKKKVLGNTKTQEETEKSNIKSKGVAHKKGNIKSVLCEVGTGDISSSRKMDIVAVERSCASGPCSESSKAENVEGGTAGSSDGVLSKNEERILMEAERTEENHSNEQSAYDQNPSSDEKENAPCSNINRDMNVNHGQSGGDNGDNNQETFKKTKAIQTINKSRLKENRPGGVGIQGVKYKKQKTTNPKPFRLRTDERSILKEATLERKQHEDENPISINSTGKVRSEGRLKNGIKKSKKNQEALMGTKTPDRSTSAKDKLASCKSQQKDANSKNSTPRSTHLQKRNQRTLQRQLLNYKC